MIQIQTAYCAVTRVSFKDAYWSIRWKLRSKFNRHAHAQWTYYRYQTSEKSGLFEEMMMITLLQCLKLFQCSLRCMCDRSTFRGSMNAITQWKMKQLCWSRPRELIHCSRDVTTVILIELSLVSSHAFHVDKWGEIGWRHFFFMFPALKKSLLVFSCYAVNSIKKS